MRRPLLVLACAVFLGAASCDFAREPAADAGEASPSAGPSADAAGAGGLCRHLSFATMNEATGENFTVAEAGGGDEVTSCVLMTTGSSFPDATLTRAQTGADAEVYSAEIPPEDAEDVEELGDVAYSVVWEAVEGGGPVLEVGWLQDGRMYSLRYTAAEGATEEQVEERREAFVEAAREIAASAAAEDEDSEDD